MTVIELPGNDLAAGGELEALVRAHGGMVYRAAVRQVKDEHLAADVMQAVFVVFQRKQSRLRAGTIVSAWLLRATRYASLTALRQRRRRAFHEREAAVMRQKRHEAMEREEDWTEVLDAALDTLGRKDREALVVTYFEGGSHKELARRAGISEEAANKRVQRALERLREKVARQGVKVSGVGVVAALGVEGQMGVVPASVMEGVMGCVRGQVPESVDMIVKGIGMMMKRMAVKIMAAAVVAGALVAGAYAMPREQVRPLTLPRIAPAAVQTETDEAFEPVMTVMLEGNRVGDDLPVDLETGKVVRTGNAPPSMMGMLDWMVENGADVVLTPDRPGRGEMQMMGVGLKFVPMSPARLETQTAKSFMQEMLIATVLKNGAPAFGPGSAGFRFQTSGGAMGMMVVKLGDGPGKGVVQIRLMRAAVRESAAAAAVNEHVVPELQGMVEVLGEEEGEAALKKAQAVSRRVKGMEEMMKGTSVGMKTAALALEARRYEEAVARGDQAGARAAAGKLKQDLGVVALDLRKAEGG